jgi:peptide deformylase
MAILPLVIAPDPRLNTPSKPVDAVNDEVRKLLNNMLDTMYANQGIGLAAVQVGVHLNVIVLDVACMEDSQGEDAEPIAKRPLKMVNPKVIESSDNLSSYEEGCLSFPGQYSDVQRPAQVLISYLDETGSLQKLTADGILATCIQHEIDHINGTVFVDHISKLKRAMIIKRLQKAKRLGNINQPDHAENTENEVVL